MNDPRIACETQESVEVEVEPNTAASDNSCASKHASRPSGFPVLILDVLRGQASAAGAGWRFLRAAGRRNRVMDKFAAAELTVLNVTPYELQ